MANKLSLTCCEVISTIYMYFYHILNQHVSMFIMSFCHECLTDFGFNINARFTYLSIYKDLVHTISTHVINYILLSLHEKGTYTRLMGRTCRTDR